jgi:hypothetical protein
MSIPLHASLNEKQAQQCSVLTDARSNFLSSSNSVAKNQYPDINPLPGFDSRPAEKGIAPLW